jgi:copper chaperone CopZ
VLLGVLANAVLRRKPSAGEVLADSQEPTMLMKIKGMTCSHCVASVRRALLECPGVQGVEVSLSSGEASIVGKDTDERAMRQAVESIGYEVVAITPR